MTEDPQELAARREALIDRVITSNGCCPAAQWSRTKPKRETEPERVLVWVTRECDEHGLAEALITIAVGPERATLSLPRVGPSE